MRIKVAIFYLLLCMSSITYAQVQNQAPSTNPTSPTIQWVSNSPSDKDRVTIDNGTGSNLSIMINVLRVDDDSPGINVSNCGKTTHIDAGSSAICATFDAKNPVSFVSDSAGDRPASGTYQVTQVTTK